jgi:hypothetical protein
MSGIIGTGGKSGVIGAGSREGWILLSSHSPSDASAVEIYSNIDSDYDNYIIVGSQVRPPVTDSQLLFQAVLGGSLRTDNYKTLSKGFTSAATEINTTSGSYAHCFIAGGSNIQSSLNYGGINFNMYLSSPSIAQRHVIWGNSAFRSSSGYAQYNYFSGTRETTTGAMTGIKFFMSSGNITGTIKLYGISK